MTIAISPTATALDELTRIAAQERAAFEDGRIEAFDNAAIIAAFERAWTAGATQEEGEHAYQLGIDWGYAAEHTE